MGMEFMIDLESVSALIGAMEGVSEVANSEAYMNELIQAAHAKVTDEFDMQIAADAMATTSLNHMYEWGTAGINRGRTTRRLNPLSPEARLWQHRLTGRGKNQAASFAFLPSKVPVPLPTTEKTGISSKYLKNLKRKHIFWNKAAVMESGTPVTIKPKAGGKLFIPHMGQTPRNARPIDIARGFTMTPNSVTLRPGGNNAGTFTAYWERFWEGRGSGEMQAHMEKGFMQDLERVMAEAQAARGTMTRPSVTLVAADIKKAKANAAKTMTSGAHARNRKRIHD